MKDRLLVLVFFLYLGISCYFLLRPLEKTPAGQVAGKSISRQTTVTATVLPRAPEGEIGFVIFGYASAGAQLFLEGKGFFDQTYANKEGYFEFDYQLSSSFALDVCISAKDQLGRQTAPVCLAPFPTDYSIAVGPIILPPTLSLNKPSTGVDYFIGDDVVLTGQAIPNTDVNLSLFTKDKQILTLVKPAYAFTFPQLVAKSDQDGNFSISLPSSSAKKYRLFAQVKFQKEYSPKSPTLSLTIFPLWMVVFRFFIFIFSIIKSRLFEILILAQIIALIFYFLRRYLHPHTVAKNRAIILKEHYPLLKEEKSLFGVDYMGTLR